MITQALGAALVAAALFGGWQWQQATSARAETVKVSKDFAEYRETQERQAREELQRVLVSKAKHDKLRQEALDAEHLKAREHKAAADRLRSSNGQLQRYAEDLAASIGHRAGDSAATGSSKTTESTAGVCPIMLGRLDAFAATVAEYADQARISGKLCADSYKALTP